MRKMVRHGPPPDLSTRASFVLADANTMSIAIFEALNKGYLFLVDNDRTTMLLPALCGCFRQMVYNEKKVERRPFGTVAEGGDVALPHSLPR